MAENQVPNSPVFPPGTRWDDTPDAKLYESPITALIRSLRKDERIREDQRWAWSRWRSGDNAIERD